MERISGTALGNRITRAGAQPALAAALARELARIHTIQPPQPALDFLGAIRNTPATDAIATYRAYLDEMPEPHPVLEWTLRWLQTNAPPMAETVLCHRDFRTGNYMVDDGALTGVLDWEFAGWGDPHEDIAWFCARCWRFAAPHLEAGGIAGRDVFYNAYEQATGRTIDLKQVHYWETMAHVRWAVIALQQAMRHRSGNEPSLELALIGRRIAEIEYECLNLTGALR
jgi:aminoglycoside phosphotransferase (APT) family kinase protein